MWAYGSDSLMKLSQLCHLSYFLCTVHSIVLHCQKKKQDVNIILWYLFIYCDVKCWIQTSYNLDNCSVTELYLQRFCSLLLTYIRYSRVRLFIPHYNDKMKKTNREKASTNTKRIRDEDKESQKHSRIVTMNFIMDMKL